MVSGDSLFECTEVLHVEHVPVVWSGQVLIELVVWMQFRTSCRESRQISMW